MFSDPYSTSFIAPFAWSGSAADTALGQRTPRVGAQLSPGSGAEKTSAAAIQVARTRVDQSFELRRFHFGD
jgi:hypothetical protein